MFFNLFKKVFRDQAIESKPNPTTTKLDETFDARRTAVKRWLVTLSFTRKLNCYVLYISLMHITMIGESLPMFPRFPGTK